MTEERLVEIEGYLAEGFFAGRPLAVELIAALREADLRNSNCGAMPGRSYPPSLLKAAADKPFDYCLKLRTGEVYYFSGADLNDGGEFVTLEFSDTIGKMDDARRNSRPFDRGLDVRLTDIVWCADAPHGS